MTTDLNTLLTALYVHTDDHLRHQGPGHRIGRPPRLSDAELITLAAAQVLLQVHSEARWLRMVARQLPGAFPYLPQQSGYNKRLRAALPLFKQVMRALAIDTDLWRDDVWVVDSTPVECARSRPTSQRSQTAGWAGYGYCASHSRFFWGLRLHLVCTPAGPAARTSATSGPAAFRAGAGQTPAVLPAVGVDVAAATGVLPCVAPAATLVTAPRAAPALRRSRSPY